MKTFILYCGHLGSTAKAAEILAAKLGDETEIIDLTKKPVIDFNKAGKIVFGTNVRMFRLNGLYKKYAKKFLKSKVEIPVYLYIVCAMAEKSADYIAKAEKILNGRCAYSVYAGGILDVDAAQGFTKKIVESVKAGYEKESKPLPSINEDALNILAGKIKE